MSNLTVDIFSGITPTAGGDAYVEPPNGIAFIRSGEIGKDGIARPTHEIQISEQTHNGLMKRSQLKRGDVLIAIVGATIGAVGIYDLNEPANINQAIAAVRLKDAVLPQFLVAFLSTPIGQEILDYLKRPVARANINLEEIGEILVPIPTLKVQCTLINEMEAARKERRRKLARADELLNSLDAWLLAQLGLEPPPVDNRQVFAVRLGNSRKRLDVHANHPRFAKLFQNLSSHKFPLITLKALAVDIFSGTTPTSGGDAYTDAAQGIPFVRSGEITKDGLVAEEQEIFLKPSIHNGVMKRSQLKKDDLLIAIVGATIGAAGVYNRSTPANINQAIAAVRLNTERVLPEYARWYLSTSVGQAILDFLKRPVARANINLEEIGGIPVLLPPLEIQQSIIEQVNKERAEARKLRLEAEAEWQAAKRRFEEQLLTGDAA